MVGVEKGQRETLSVASTENDNLAGTIPGVGRSLCKHILGFIDTDLDLQ